MKTSILTISLLPVFTFSLISAEPSADVKAAAKKLAAKPNYSWTSTPKSESGNTPGSGPTEGQTEKDGFTYVTFSIGNNDIELAFKGDKAAIKREGEWQSSDQLEGDSAWIARRLKQFKAPAAEAEDLVEKLEDLKKGFDLDVKNPISPPDDEIADTETIITAMLESQARIRDLLMQFRA